MPNNTLTKKDQKITEKTTLQEVLKVKGTEEVLSKFRLPCLHCPMAAYEIHALQIGGVCDRYGINSKKLLEELNKLLK